MGLTSPRFKSPTRQLRSSRLRERSLSVVEPHDGESSYSQRLPTLHSRRLANFAIACMVIFCPPLVIYLWYAHLFLDGSLTELRSFIRNDQGLLHAREIWPKPSLSTLKIISFFTVSQALLLLFLPGTFYAGPVTPTGNRPVYKGNGFAAYFTTMLTYYILWREGLFNPGILYDLLGEILSVTIAISVFLSVALYIKGLKNPSTSDWVTSGNVVLDLFWGMELHPRIGRRFDIKIFINSRLGMMSWALLVISYMCKQYQSNNGRVSDSLLVSGSLVLLYITKHFWLEQSYFSSLDIADDRVGLYSLWCSLVWIPSVYTSPALFLASHPIHLGYKVACPIFMLGLISIGILFDCDNQKMIVRNTKGKCEIWGQPITKINAQYTTVNGQRHSNLLLTSGWWGKSRHFHYLPEMALAFFWTLPCLLTHCLPYFYFLSVICSLVDRAKRVDERCRRKYKKYWEVYCKRVPWKIIPKAY